MSRVQSRQSVLFEALLPSTDVAPITPEGFRERRIGFSFARRSMSRARRTSSAGNIRERARHWIPVPYIDTHAAEILFREKVFRLLQEHDLLSDECIKILRSWRWSGFSIDNDVFLYPSDTQALETLCRYVVRCPVSLRRLHCDKKSNYVLYQPKSKNRKAELPVEYDPLDFLARVLIHIPQPNQHSILYYGHYARRTRKHTRKKNDPPKTTTNSTPPSVKL